MANEQSAPLTDAELAEIAAREAKATPAGTFVQSAARLLHEYADQFNRFTIGRGAAREIADELDRLTGELAAARASLARCRAETARRCADIAADEDRLYLENSRLCDAKGNVHGGTSDIHGALACQAVRKRIEAEFGLVPAALAAAGRPCGEGG